MATTAEVLHDAAQRLAAASIPDARIEAELLLMHALGVTREALYARLQDAVDSATRDALVALVTRRLAHEPSAYITGHREFYGLDLLCAPDALIPRPETELLVDQVLAHIGTASALVIDVGTGGGAIAVAIAANASNARLLAVDPSRASLGLARDNANRCGVIDRVDFVQGSLLGPLRTPAAVIVANLPYISTAEYAALAPEIRKHEPPSALHAGPRGTELIEALLDAAPPLLAPSGMLIAEHAWDQAGALRVYAARAFPGARGETLRDLAGLDRALAVRTK